MVLPVLAPLVDLLALAGLLYTSATAIAITWVLFGGIQIGLAAYALHMEVNAYARCGRCRCSRSCTANCCTWSCSSPSLAPWPEHDCAGTSSTGPGTAGQALPAS